jgi:hypothetical protein
VVCLVNAANQPRTDASVLAQVPVGSLPLEGMSHPPPATALETRPVQETLGSRGSPRRMSSSAMVLTAVTIGQARSRGRPLAALV